MGVAGRAYFQITSFSVIRKSVDLSWKALVIPLFKEGSTNCHALEKHLSFNFTKQCPGQSAEEYPGPHLLPPPPFFVSPSGSSEPPGVCGELDAAPGELSCVGGRTPQAATCLPGEGIGTGVRGEAGN